MEADEGKEKVCVSVCVRERRKFKEGHCTQIGAERTEEQRVLR